MHTSRQQQNTFQQKLKLNIEYGKIYERKTCTSENSLQKLSKKPNKHKSVQLNKSWE